MSVTYFLLSLTHGQELELVAAKLDSVRQFHQVTGGVRAGTENKHNRRIWRTLLIDGIKTDDGWSDVFLPDTFGHVVGDSAEDSVNTETAQQHETLEVCQVFLIVEGQVLGLRGVVIKPLEDERRWRSVQNSMSISLIVKLKFTSFTK